MSSPQPITGKRKGTHLSASDLRKDATYGWIESIDNPSKRICLLNPATRRLNVYASPKVLDEVKRGLRWGRHRLSVPSFRPPILSQARPRSHIDILAMPLKPFYVIASFLDPRDLLKLARINKTMRERLMTRRARPVWRDVIDREGKTCPEDMSEPAYLALMYDEHCMGCNTAYPSVDFRQTFLRLRLCDDCAALNLRPKSEVVEELQEQCHRTPKDVTLVLDILPAYDAEDFHAHSGLVGYDVHQFNRSPEENSLVFVPEYELLIDAFRSAKEKGVDPFHKFYRGRCKAKVQRQKDALLLAQTAQHIVKSQLRIPDLRAPPVDPRAPYGPEKAWAARVSDPTTYDSPETSEEDEESDDDSEAEERYYSEWEPESSEETDDSAEWSPWY